MAKQKKATKTTDSRIRRTQIFSSTVCDIQGNIFLPSQLQKAFLRQNLRQTEADYQYDPGLRFSDEASRAWKIAQASWNIFVNQTSKSDISQEQRIEAVKTFAKQFFSSALSFTLEDKSERTIEDRSFPVGYVVPRANIPIVIGDPSVKQDQRQAHFANFVGSAHKTLFQSAQELLNADKDFTWGFSFNGKSVRLLRDAMSFTRPSYVEFSLEDIFSNEDYSEFLHLYAVLHASRAVEKNGRNVWEDWIKAGEDEGQPARENLSVGIKRALEILGNGFLRNHANEALREAIASKELTEEGFLKELLRTMYRFLFLFCLEERGLLNTKGTEEKDQLARERYAEGYSMHRFRDRCLKRKYANQYTDAWKSVRIVFRGLAKGEPLLALPALGGLFDSSQCPHLDHAELDNDSFYCAMNRMRWATLNGIFAAVDYKNMGTEELGSIYESLLELFPLIDLDRRVLSFGGDTAGDTTRKNSGSYYTPDAFVKKIISTALIPVIERALNENKDKEKALLSLRVIDPACGSGHFLLGAARTIADYLAKVRSLTGAVTPEEYRRALRDVIMHCIYGVDINDLAIELARMALWLEGYSENHPLSFLDHHLKVGNSVVGVMDLDSITKGIIPAAFQETSDDDNDELNFSILELRAANKKGLSQLRGLKKNEDTSDLFNFSVSFPQIESIDDLPSQSLSDEERKAQRYAKNRETLRNSEIKKLCDLLLAGYLADKKKNQSLIPTSETIAQYLSRVYAPTVPMDDILKFSESLCRERKVFHWPIEFPEVFSEGGGFDCVLGNPPWEKPKVEDEKWFSNRYPAIAEAKPAAKRKKMIAALAEGTVGEEFLQLPATPSRSQFEKDLFEKYQIALQHAQAASIFGHVKEHEGGRFPLTGKGDTNLYAYFAELSIQLLKANGAAGLITPPGLLTDDATKLFAQYAFDGNLQSFYHFDNTEKLFPIHSSYSFALITFAKAEKVDCVFYASRIEHLDENVRHVTMSGADIQNFNPNTKTLVLVRTNRDLEILRKLYGVSPILCRIEEKKVLNNPWHLRTMSMFHMTNDSFLFHTEPEPGLVPLYEGKMIHQFDDRWATFDVPGKPNEARDVTIEEKQDPEFEVLPEYWVSEDAVVERFTLKDGTIWWSEPWMLGIRGITRATDQRTLISSVLPSAYGAGNSMNLLFPGGSEPEIACFLANLNSTAVDYVERIKQSGSNANLFILQQLPILSPDQYPSWAKEYIVPRVAKLTRNSNAIRDVWLTDYPDYQFQEPRERLKIRAELDACFAHLYKLSRKDLAYILDPQGEMGEDYPSVTFPSLKEEEIGKYGEFLTKRLVLEAFDQLAKKLVETIND